MDNNSEVWALQLHHKQVVGGMNKKTIYIGKKMLRFLKKVIWQYLKTKKKQNAVESMNYRLHLNTKVYCPTYKG